MIFFDDSAFIGGHPVLDFINTVDDQDKQRNLNLITDWSSFVAWAQAASVFSKAQMKILNNGIPDSERNTLLSEIQDLKETTYTALNCMLSPQATTNPALGKLEFRIQTAISYSSLVSHGSGFRWEPKSENLNWVVDFLVLLIENFLCHTDITKLRVCKRCTWMFLNSGRGRGRQWCSMKTCGNRAKLVSFRERNQ